MKATTIELQNRLVYDRGVCKMSSFIEAQELIWSIITSLGFEISAQMKRFVLNMDEPLLSTTITTDENRYRSCLKISYFPANKEITLTLNNNIILFRIKYK